MSPVLKMFPGIRFFFVLENIILLCYNDCIIQEGEFCGTAFITEKAINNYKIEIEQVVVNSENITVTI